MLNNKRRIAFIHDEFPGGGGERVTMDIAGYLSGFDYEVFVYSGFFCADRMPAGLSEKFTVIELPERYVEKSEADAEAMVKHIKEKGIQVLVSVGRQMLFIEEIRKRTGCKYVYALHSVPFWETELVIERARRRAARSWAARLEWYIISYPKYVLCKKAFHEVRRQYECLYNQSDRFTVLCEAYKKELVRKLNLNPDTNKIRVLPNSQAQAENLQLNKKKQLLYVGRLSYSDKRVDRLVNIWKRIFRQVPEWELVIVGDGEEREKLERSVRVAGLERIRFAGFVSDTSSYYREASVLCLVSTFEGWPLSLTEAQANGVVPVAFNCSAGVQEILSPSGVNGVLISPFDLAGFADALVKLMKDPEWLETMQANVVNKSKEYNIEQATGQKWLSLMDELFESKKLF